METKTRKTADMAPFWVKRGSPHPTYPDLHNNYIMGYYGPGKTNECVIATLDNDDEGAAYIVQACNAYPALLEALEALEAEATIALVMLSKEDTQGKRLYQAAIVKARAALAATKEKE